MKVSCYSSSEISQPTIDRLIGQSFYASAGFASLWQCKGGRLVYWTVEDADRVVGILPGIVIGRKPLERFMAMPDGLYGRLFVHPDRVADRETVGTLLLETLSRQLYQKLYIYDFYRTLPEHPQFDVQFCETTLIDISDAEWQPPDKKLQSQIRKAEREGIRVVPFDWQRHRQQFMNLMEQSERRHGRDPKYPEAFFEALASLARHDGRVRWMWCEHGGRGACSHIYFIEDKMLQGWQIYFDKEFSFLKPNQYISFSMCRELSVQGLVTTLNLGGTPAEAEGLAYYKKRWGGQHVRYGCLVKKKGLGRFL